MSVQEAFKELELTNVVTSLDHLKGQYRRLAMKWHPDKNSSEDALARMVRINLAYECLMRLMDEDTQLQHPSARQGTSATHAYAGNPFNQFDFEQQQEEERRQAREAYDEPPPYAKRGRTITRKLKITLFEAVFGCKKVVEGEVTDHCPTCGGSSREGRFIQMCTVCHGAGFWHSTAHKTRPYSRYEPCEACHRRGFLERSCETCGNTGAGPTRQWSFGFTLVPGVRNGYVIREAGDGGRSTHEFMSGDMVITVEIQDHPHFRFDEEGRLRVSAPVSIWTWMLGGEVVVPLLDGAKLVTFPSRASTVEIAGQGYPMRPGSPERWPLIVDIIPRSDEDISAEKISLLEQLAREHSDGVLRYWDEAMRKWTHETTEGRWGTDKPKKKPSAKKAATKKKSAT